MRKWIYTGPELLQTCSNMTNDLKWKRLLGQACPRQRGNKPGAGGQDNRPPLFSRWLMDIYAFKSQSYSLVWVSVNRTAQLQAPLLHLMDQHRVESGVPGPEVGVL